MLKPKNPNGKLRLINSMLHAHSKMFDQGKIEFSTIIGTIVSKFCPDLPSDIETHSRLLHLFIKFIPDHS